MTAIRERYLNTLSQIMDAAAGCGRKAGEIRLIVVSKTQPLELVREAVLAGITTFGENYAEEAIPKIAALKETPLEWHMIGHVQSRKADLVAKYFNVVHSLDNLRLASRLERFCSEMKRTLPVLLEFNVSGETSKFGFPAWDENTWPDLKLNIEKILEFSHLEVHGLMTMPPFFDDSERARPYFHRLRKLQDFLKNQFPTADWRELSMGTSVDFVAAIQEGATFVRIGQAIFGPRGR